MTRRNSNRLEKITSWDIYLNLPCFSREVSGEKRHLQEKTKTSMVEKFASTLIRRIENLFKFRQKNFDLKWKRADCQIFFSSEKIDEKKNSIKIKIFFFSSHELVGIVAVLKRKSNIFLVVVLFLARTKNKRTLFECILSGCINDV